MDDVIGNANVYSAYLEGEANKDETCAILKKMICDDRLMLTLNIAATVSRDMKQKGDINI